MLALAMALITGSNCAGNAPTTYLAFASGDAKDVALVAPIVARCQTKDYPVSMGGLLGG